MLDDQAIIVKMADNSIGVITGCSHSGIINILKYSMKITELNYIRFVLGGFHLINASDDRVNLTVHDLKAINPDYISPMHCSGPRIISKILNEMPRKFLYLTAGDQIEFKATGKL